jgi:hypothetical protein
MREATMQEKLPDHIRYIHSGRRDDTAQNGGEEEGKEEKEKGRQKRTEAAVEEEEQEEVTYTMSMEDRDTGGVPQMLHANQGPVRHAATFHAPAP